MDGEFAPLEADVKNLGMQLNTTAANEHVPQIERQIRVIKERTRCVRHTLPFKYIPRLMLIEMVHTSVLWLNVFPPKGGVSDTISPRLILTGIPFDYNKHCKYVFGTYGQVHEEPTPSNTQVGCTVGAICLGPKGNLQGSYKFMNLRTGKKITRWKFTPLPMPQEVIDRVNELGKAEKQPQLLVFYDRHGRVIGDLTDLHTPIAGVDDDAENTGVDEDEVDPAPAAPDEELDGYADTNNGGSR